MNKPYIFFIQHALRSILFGIAGAVIFYLVVFFISAKCFGIPSFFGWRPYFILTESMEPTIRRYQFVLAKVMDSEDIGEGDIVVYVKSGSPVFGYHVIHRVVGVNAKGFVCKGDNNTDVDPQTVLPSHVLYRIIE